MAKARSVTPITGSRCHENEADHPAPGAAQPHSHSHAHRSKAQPTTKTTETLLRTELSVYMNLLRNPLLLIMKFINNNNFLCLFTIGMKNK